jgi:hypothetical protein
MPRLKDAFTVMKRDPSRRPSLSCKSLRHYLTWKLFFVWGKCAELGADLLSAEWYGSR